MGKLLKRVPLDFDYSLNKIWEGYINPHYVKCSHCEGGRTEARGRLRAIVKLLMLSGSDSLRGKNHPYFDYISGNISGFDGVPTSEMADLTEGLAGRRAGSGWGHDSSDGWRAENKIIEAAGLDPAVWGVCSYCSGSAIDADHEAAYEAWEGYEPPAGDGFQLWENTSEGSPVSPVFKTLDELCDWCEGNAHTFAYFKATKEEWLQMLSDDFVSHKEGNAIFF